MSNRRAPRRFQPVIAELPMRIAPTIFGATPALPIEITQPPELPYFNPPQASRDLLCTTAPDSTC